MHTLQCVPEFLAIFDNSSLRDFSFLFSMFPHRNELIHYLVNWAERWPLSKVMRHTDWVIYECECKFQSKFLSRQSIFQTSTMYRNNQEKYGYADVTLIFYKGGGKNLERRNLERPIFRNFKITNIKITKDELFDSFIFEFIFSSFINYLNNLIIFQIVKYWFSKW